ncbi:sco1 family electron transport protein [Bacillus sp. OxB-1]|uniref:SCO family protein n=1 Tax=Bacillus sp. (strain OxB-1) TaxID=98228 RepID=UPI000581F1D0|nr:SCO family protein [Bacillus sp. OxB-1]BAQ11096.1 sco1 family electron transport protein [Bacillus sp. OxB-1]
MKKIRLPILFILMLLVSACSGPGGFKADHKYEVPPFEYTNQNGEKVSLDDLKGHVWLAQFVFTNCTSVCPPMMMNMAKIEEDLEKAGVEDYKIVSFSVDPKVDTPEKLQEYLELFNVKDESRWEMLTGYTMEEIAALAMKSFKTVVADIPDDDQVLHGTTFALVNQEGQVVKLYSGVEEVPFDQIEKDVEALIKEGA